MKKRNHQITKKMKKSSRKANAGSPLYYAVHHQQSNLDRRNAPPIRARGAGRGA